jgi:pimeloyl-ACP methyl ester carboxylesterase
LERLLLPFARGAVRRAGAAPTMGAMPKPHLPAAALAAALLAWPLGAAAAAAAADAPPAPCRLRGVEHEALCGSVRRALDPARPAGPHIDVHYAVLPALARNKKPDPVFFFAGGPGQSAIDLAPQIAVLLGRFGNRRDIVLVDQRGTGRSAPLQCEAEDPALPLAEQFDLQRARARLAQCLQRLQALPHGDLRFFTTPIAMADADAVRAALGAERINAVGGSYGTRAVLEYQRQFPQRVRRAVIDGVAPPDMVLPASFSTDNQAALDALLAACAADAACNAREPGLAARWAALRASLPRKVTLAHPVTGRPETVEMSAPMLAGLLRAPLYVPALASALPAAMGEATRGRFEPLAALAVGLSGSRRSAQLAAGMHFAVVCAEDFPRLAAAADRPGADFGDAFADIYRDACAALPRAEVPPAFYSMVPATQATLVLSGGIDPVTPPRHGQRAAKALGALARHVEVPSAGHGVMGIGCMRDVLYRFVDAATDADALAVDAACVTAIPRPPMFALPVPAAVPQGGSK